jgi:hypothetical protein
MIVVFSIGVKLLRALKCKFIPAKAGIQHL